jgi:hypothetical protein
MRRFLNWLCRPFRSNVTAGCRNSARLQVEQLEDRQVPTATSAITTLHGSGYLRWQTHDLYAIDPVSHQVVDFQTNTFGGNAHTALGGPTNVRAVSASIDPSNGYAEVFAETWNWTLWRCDSHGAWTQLSDGVASSVYGDISATRDGQIYAVNLHNQYVELFHTNGSVTNLGNPEGYLRTINGSGNGQGIAAGVDLYGGNEVFAIGQYGALYVWSGDGLWAGAWRTIDSSRLYVSVSAARDGGVFANFNGLGMWHWTEQWSAWGGPFTFWSGQDISGGMGGPDSTFWDISADTDARGHAEVYARIAVGYNQFNLYRYDQGSWQLVDVNVSEVAGADGGYFFDVNPNGDSTGTWAFDPYKSGSPWIYLGGPVL